VPLCDSNFVLVSDINLDPNLADSQVFDQVIIPTFTGVFDGNDHTISNMVINGYSYLGLFGKLESGAEIKNLGITDVNITGSSDYIGGLVGYNYGTVTNCYSTGTVSGDDYIGGLVGYNYGTVINCYSSGTVSGNKEVGGLVGESKDGIITNCYSTGTVSGYWDVGGLVGLNYGDVTNCYSSCTVHGNGCVGGLLGQNPYGNITYCYSTGTASGDDNIGGLVGYKGSETISNCYSIGTVSGGVGIGGLVGSNIYSTVTNCYSTGTISGNEEVGGLVGYNNANSSVENCYSSGSVSGYYYVGGLVGYNNDNSSVENCYSSGSVSGDSVIGGLVGYSLDSTINNCYSNNTVSGTTAIGGLVGYNSKGTVFNCYCTSFVEGNNYIGGMIGYNNLSEVNYCFWDFEVSTIIDGIGNMDPDPNGVIGKTTIEMYDPNTFLDAGWDFIGETINGPNDVWWILEGKDYPYLWWQLPVDDFNDCDAAPLWLAYEPEPELAHLEEVNGRLEVNTAGAMEDLDAIYIPYNWALDANKPFSVQVDFHFSKIGTGDGRVNIGIVPSLDPSANKWAEFEVGTFDDNPFYLYEIRDGIWEEEQTCSRFLEDGTLFISYDPNSDELYFSSLDYGKDNAIWTVPDLIRAQWQCESIYIIISGGSEDGMALTGEDAWLDNFKVQEGTITQ
ncbi:MAG: hypothetical protein JXA96_01930, partial [Sedimentisphaerales bacterium]|nr:hypothetical protein [Sedimentisphaerales bacterium]